MIQVIIFRKKIGANLRRAIAVAGGKSASQELQEVISSLLERKKTVIKAFCLADRADFPQGPELKNILNRRINDLPLSTRVINILNLRFSEHNPVFVYHITLLKEIDLLKVLSCGRKRQMEVRNVLRSLGLDFIDCLSKKERNLVELVAQSRS